MKIAWFTPFHRRSAIGNYSHIICKELRREHEVVVFASDLEGTEGAWDTEGPVVCLRGADRAQVLRDLPGFGAVVYNMGDSTYHHLVYDYLRLYPGIVVLHDLVVRHFFGNYFLTREPKDLEGFLALMQGCHGKAGRDWLLAVLESGFKGYWADRNIVEYHMAEAVLQGCHGVVVHSEYTRRRVAAFAGYPVTRIHFPAPPLAAEAGRWGEPPAAPGGRVRVLTFGMINGNKQVDRVIETIGRSAFLRERVTYTVLGEVTAADDLARLEGLIEEYGLEDVVGLLGRQSDERLHRALRDADVVVNLRKPHLGESSWSLLESLFAGKPTVVWDHGYYAEFPEGVVRKVASRQRLGKVLEELCGSAELRRAVGARARAYAVCTFDTARYCREFLEFVGRVLAHRPVLRVTDAVGKVLAEMAPWPEAHRLAGRVAEEVACLVRDGEGLSEVACRAPRPGARVCHP